MYKHETDGCNLKSAVVSDVVPSAVVRLRCLESKSQPRTVLRERLLVLWESG